MELQNLGFTRACQDYFALFSGDEGLFPARVSFASRGHFRIIGETGDFMASLSGRARNGVSAFIPVVGDWVAARDAGEGLAVIHEVMPRVSVLSRTSPGGRRSREGMSQGTQALAANVTKSLIVCGLDRDFNPRRIERYAALSYGGGVSPVVLLNKADLCADAASAAHEAALAAPGAEVLTLSALDGSGVEVVRSLIGPMDTVCLLGSSGAGKSTLLNALLNDERRETSAVSGSTGKGRHTTTDRELFFLSGGGLIIDTPGLREVGVAFGDGLLETFPEVAEFSLSCRYADCSHAGEPGCAVTEAVAEGKISRERYESFLRLKKESEFRQRAGDSSFAAVEKKKWKAISKEIKRFYKDR